MDGQGRSESGNKEESEKEAELVPERDDNYKVGRADKWKMPAIPELLAAGSGEDPGTDLQTTGRGVQEQFQQTQRDDKDKKKEKKEEKGEEGTGKENMAEEED